MALGIVFGLCLGLVVRNHRALERMRQCDSFASAGDRRKLLKRFDRPFEPLNN